MESLNTSKYILAILISLMLVSSFAASGLVTVQASPDLPWEGEPITTIHATVTNNPYWGYYGGYHDVWAAIKAELVKIGINLEINYYDDFTWWGRVWADPNWNKTWEDGGFDLTMLEWWLQPHAVDPWFSSMLIDYPEGFDIHYWTSEKADELLLRAMTSFDAETRKYFLWKWQELFMHDAPWVNIWYPRIYETIGKWIDGYDPTGSWWYDITELSLNVSAMPDARKLLDLDTVYYGVSETVWTMLPWYTDTYTEEQMETVQWDTLYRWSLNWTNHVQGQEVATTDYIIVPELAAIDPYPVNGNYSHMRVILREGIKWSDYATTGEILDAEDVVWSINTGMLDTAAKGSGTGDFIWFMDHAEIVNDTAVDLILKAPTPDLKSLMANDWGGSILPYHKLGHLAPQQINLDASNYPTDPDAWLPVTGPFKLKQIVVDDFALLERNPLYFGYDLGWGPDESVQKIYLKWVPDPAVRLLEFQTYKLDFGEYPTAPIEAWQALAEDPNLNVFQYNYPASNPIWFNFQHELLSNRWVRMAIAHAVPYEKIISEILPSWGIETAFPGKTYVMPTHYYTEPNTGGDLVGTRVHLFNEDLEPWSYNITKAMDYMELWWYGDHDPASSGAVGDSDLSGLVDLDDYLIFRANAETDPGITWPQEAAQGNIIDPDFNNDDHVTVADDFPLWAGAYGVEY